MNKRLVILSDEPLERTCQVCESEPAERLVRFKIDGKLKRRFCCLACRKWLRGDIEIPRDIRAEQED